ncbi:MAG: peroxiredoxin [Bacteroidia bacterium]|jgi:peroxiredoxin
MKQFTSLSLFISLAVISFLGCGSQGASSKAQMEEAVASTQKTIFKVNSFELSDLEELNDVVAEKTNFVLKGKIISDKAENTLVFLNYLDGPNLKFSDTTRVDSKGRYQFSGTSADEKFYYVTLGTGTPPGVPILLQDGETVQLDIETGLFYKTAVKGNESNSHLKQLYDIYTTHNEESANFQKGLEDINPNSLSDSARNAISFQYAAMQKRFSSDVVNFIETTKGGPCTYFAVSYVMQEPPVTVLNKALVVMKKDAPKHPLTKALESKINNIAPLSVGGLAPEIALKSPDGEVITLSSLRGKVVLIDFWASWCGPCRKENPNVVRMYKKYHDQGFEVYSVSLDNSKDKWMNAIQQDGLTWTHVSDLKGWQSSAAQLYKVSGIPKTFLLDTEGRILATDLRGSDLEARLAQLFAQ